MASTSPWSSSASSSGSVSPRGSVFGLNSPPTPLQCHMEWVHEMMPGYLAGPEKEDYLNKTIKCELQTVQDLIRQKYPKWTQLENQLCLAALYAHQGNFPIAVEWLNEAAESCNVLRELDASNHHHMGFEFLVQANFYKINRRMKLLQDVDLATLNKNTSKQLRDLEQLYDLKKNSPAFLARILHSQAALAETFRNQELAIALMRKCKELEPSNAFFHRDLYCILRGKRRETRRNARTLSPSPEEIKAIEEAFRLNPDDELIKSRYASMLDERLRSNKQLYLPEKQEQVVNQIIELMTESIEANPEEVWTQVRLAEIYAYGYFPHLDAQVGVRMFEDLEQRWPDNSMVLHKFGLYYGKNGNNTKALEYYIQSLEFGEDNFPCLMDFIKASRRLDKGLSFMKEMIEKCLPSIRRTPSAVKLMAMKGMMQWLLEEDGSGRQEACRTWIATIEKIYSSVTTIAEMISRGYMDEFGKASIDVDDVLTQLNSFLNVARYQKDSEKCRAISRLVSELEKCSAGRRKGDGTSFKSARSNMSSMSTCSFATAQTGLSVSDSVDNWRVGSIETGVKRSLFAPYQDPFEIRTKERLAAGIKFCDEPPVQVVRNGKAKKLTEADLNDNWRR